MPACLKRDKHPKVSQIGGQTSVCSEKDVKSAKACEYYGNCLVSGFLRNLEFRYGINVKCNVFLFSALPSAFPD